MPSRLPGPLHPVSGAFGTGGKAAVQHPPGPPRPPTKLSPKEAEIAIDLMQFALDLVGIVDPTPISDGASAVISLARGNWFDAAISGVSMIPYVGDIAKAGKLGRYAKTVAEAVELAAKNPAFAQAIRPGLRKLEEVLAKLPLDSLPPKVRGPLEQALGRIRSHLPNRKGRYSGGGGKHMASAARRNGSTSKTLHQGTRSGPFRVQVGRRTMMMNADRVVDLLVESASPNRHAAVRKNSNALLEMMAKKEWIMTAAPHRSVSDMTPHITIFFPGVHGQYHLRLDKRGHLFEVSHLQDTGLKPLNPAASPGTDALKRK